MAGELRFAVPLASPPSAALRFGYLALPPEPPELVAVRALVKAGWRRAAHSGPVPLATSWRPGIPLAAAGASPWGRAAAIASGWRTPWQAAPPLGAAVRAGWGNAGQVSRAIELRWGGAAFIGGQWAVGWRAAAGLDAALCLRWQGGLAVHHAPQVAWAAAHVALRPVWARFRQAAVAQRQARLPWQDGAGVYSVGSPWVIPVPPVVPPVVPCYAPSPAVRFADVLTRLARLLFACRHGALVRVPSRRVYMVVNVTSLTRVAGGVAIPCIGFSLSLDVDSWAWGFSASLPGEALALIQPTEPGEAVELEAMVNGTAFRLIAESMGRERVFGTEGVRVQGRGKTAVLDAPYSAVQTFSAASALTSQQLLDQAMPSGWTANWGLTAWSVPGGVWSHQGTPATAAAAIAAAGGGYLQPHASLQQVSVLPRYPVAPWLWGGLTPDLELPAAVTTREAIEWVQRARYNAVYVAGTTAGGVLGRVKRTGTAGDVVARMVTDPLITHVDAARQRGLPILAETGGMAYVTLRLPVLPATAVIRPGALVRYLDGAVTRLGLVRSTSVDVGPLEVWQSIMVETHVD